MDADIPVKKSAPTWTPIFQEFSSMDADIPEFGSSVDADIPGIWLQRGRRYSIPAWIPIFQEFGSNVDTDIPVKAISSSLDTETQDKDQFQRKYRNPKGTEKTKIRLSGLPKIEKPRFVGWISDE
ncbi:hypothetical protein RhiirB3_456449 [Rhizophagus irregularis]|nr:hypothetical protein RhiirB3_456449 [Rhizophagus irregularis]